MSDRHSRHSRTRRCHTGGAAHAVTSCQTSSISSHLIRLLDADATHSPVGDEPPGYLFAPSSYLRIAQAQWPRLLRRAYALSRGH